MATLLDLNTVEVIAASGEVQLYLVRPEEPYPEESAAWSLVRDNDVEHRVSLYPRDGLGRVRCDSRGWWACSCADFRYRHRTCRGRSPVSGCKHTDAIRAHLDGQPAGA